MDGSRRAGRVAAVDGTQIVYEVCGAGPVMVLCNGFTTSSFFWKHLIPLWMQRFTVVTWDYRGHGLSDPAMPPGSASIPGFADDLRCVLNAIGVESCILVGFSMGCQVALEACRTMSPRIVAVVALFGGPGQMMTHALGPVGTVLHGVMRLTPKIVFAGALRTLAFGIFRTGRLSYKLGQLLRLVGPDARYEDVKDYCEHITRVDPATIAQMGVAAEAYSAKDLLPVLTQPTLVVLGERDVFCTPSGKVGASYQGISKLDLVCLHHGTHTSLFEHYAEIDDIVMSFLRQHSLYKAGPEALLKSAL
uniref:AB hydrolase-1 domain-containing protein n=1 Tax=Pyrodinium bahamense TaxID=73915 RepID=A0A7S0BCK3_9DINO|mmetsp:Transcript_9134/g.25542  ORF Transcript_9134/g.25542 Transcript_9134/m.25542 type:complete len:305 (+) Transcript_9134:121-1035(+)